MAKKSKIRKSKPTRPETLKPKDTTRAELSDSLRRELKRLRETTDAAFKAFESERDPLLQAPLMARWLKLQQQLTQLARVQPKADLDAASVLLKDDVENTWRRMIIEFRKTLENVPRRVATLPAFAKCNPVDVEQVLRVEIDAAIQMLRGSDAEGAEAAA